MSRHRMRGAMGFPLWPKVLLAAAGCAVMLGTGKRAWSAPVADQLTTARELFDQGRKLMGAGKYADACTKFEESQRLDPGGGTLLNLALCNELVGKTASAWVQFRDGLHMARRDYRVDRERLAEEHIASLAPRLSRLRIVVTADARTPGFVVRRDGVPLGKSAWGEAFAVDPGEHVVAAHAPGKIPANRELQPEFLPE